jgi:type II secretion system protein H
MTLRYHRTETAATDHGIHRRLFLGGMQPMRPRKSNTGFSLIEMLVVIAMVGILAGMAIASFAGQKRQYDVANQVKRIYADLSNVKMMAMTKGRTHFVVLNANGYTAYDDNAPAPDGNDTLTGADTVALRSSQTLNLSTVSNQQFLPITWSGPAQMAFNSRGLCTTADNTVCIYSSATPRYDCINITATRMALGKLAVQGACSAANCQIQ